MKTLYAAVWLLASLWTTHVHAQEPLEFAWQRGPSSGAIGGQATINIPQDYVFLDAEETSRYVEATENLPSGDEYLFGPVNDKWEAYFSFAPDGFVKDDETLDAEALLESLREAQAEANIARRERGWVSLEIKGWHVPPHYNPATRTLEWATLSAAEGSGRGTVNYNTRVLGRRGTMAVQVVARPENFEAGLAEFKERMDGFSYNAGERYADYRPGDHVAEYGLAALITGGAVAVAGKKGFFGIIAAFVVSMWKLLLAGVVGLGVWLRSRFKRKNEGP